MSINYELTIMSYMKSHLYPPLSNFRFYCHNILFKVNLIFFSIINGIYVIYKYVVII